MLLLLGWITGLVTDSAEWCVIKARVKMDGVLSGGNPEWRYTWLTKLGWCWLRSPEIVKLPRLVDRHKSEYVRTMTKMIGNGESAIEAPEMIS